MIQAIKRLWKRVFYGIRTYKVAIDRRGDITIRGEYFRTANGEKHYNHNGVKVNATYKVSNGAIQGGRMMYHIESSSSYARYAATTLTGHEGQLSFCKEEIRKHFGDTIPEYLWIKEVRNDS